MRIDWRPHRFEIFAVLAIATGLGMAFFGRVSHIKRGEMCQSNLKRVGLAMFQYIRDYDEKYPLGHGWSESLYPYCKKASIFHCPATPQFGYSLNVRLVGLNMNDISDPTATPMVFESSVLQEFQHDAGETWMTKPRHPQGSGVIFADGRAYWRQQPPSFPTLPDAKFEFPIN